MAKIIFDEYLDTSVPVVRAGNEAFGLWVFAVCRAVRKDTKGFVSAAWIAEVADEPTARRLVEVGLFAPAEGGYLVESPKVGGRRTAYAVALPSSRAKIPDDVKLTVYVRDGYACVLCGATDDLTLDHIHPWSKGGPDTVENLRVLCRSCNSRKGARV